MISWKCLRTKVFALMHQICARMNFSKAVDAKTVGLVHVPIQKLAASVPIGQDFQQVSSTQQVLTVMLVDVDVAGVGILNQADHPARFKPIKCDQVLPCFS